MFLDEIGNTFSVGLAAAFAETGAGEFKRDFDLALLPSTGLLELNWVRLIMSETASPVLVLVQWNGRITVADGRHRVARARLIERLTTLPAWVLPWTYAAKSASQIQFEVFDHL